MKISCIAPAAYDRQVPQREDNQAGEAVGEKRFPEKALDMNRPWEEREEITREELDKAVEQANETMKLYKTSILFKIHEKSGEYYAQVINADTKEVIREVPPEWVLDLVAHIREMVGLIVDELV
ncbi:flagellar protein FlaG [Desulfohalotomaculum tongense]|uniref:flagellar protein FlaG n=1 Tax=Desulforadius tongensis TaxID=1216062 RepID=UPI00195EDCFA|nr:flagellar protein FlaG [Desulforadius tongensis]MBM7854203.1 flagellar protein FlaG [Desulforadius tongensis]